MRRVVAAVLAGLLAGAACGDDRSPAEKAAAERAGQARDLARRAGLGAEVGTFLAAAAGAAGERYTVTYVLPGEGGTAMVTQDPPRRRIDVTSDEEGEETTRTALANASGSFTCVRRGGQWTCRRSPGRGPDLGPFGAGDLQEATDRLRRSRADYEFRVVGRRMVGVEARCLVTELRPGREPSAELGRRGTLCVSPQGAALLVETPTSSLRAARYSTDVDDGAFDLPAPAT